METEFVDDIFKKLVTVLAISVINITATIIISSPKTSLWTTLQTNLLLFELIKKALDFSPIFPKNALDEQVWTWIGHELNLKHNISWFLCSRFSHRTAVISWFWQISKRFVEGWEFLVSFNECFQYKTTKPISSKLKTGSIKTKNGFKTLNWH